LPVPFQTGTRIPVYPPQITPLSGVGGLVLLLFLEPVKPLVFIATTGGGRAWDAVVDVAMCEGHYFGLLL